MKVMPEKIIESCHDCPNFDGDNWCNEADIFINSSFSPDYPETCPLEDAPEWKDKPDTVGKWWLAFKTTYNGWIFSTEAPIYLDQSLLDAYKKESMDPRSKWYPATVPSLPEDKK
jgi:hypothetical protein